MNVKDYLFPNRDIQQEWNSRKNAKELPPIYETRLHLDVNRLKNLYFSNLNRNLEGNYEKTVIRESLSEQYTLPTDYWPLSLSRYNDKAITCQTIIDGDRQQTWQEHQKTLSTKQRIRSLIYIDDDYDPLIDERNCTQLEPFIKNTYIEEIYTSFKARSTRIRFTKLAPQKWVGTHIDCSPKYNVRAHIPILTNDKCFNGYVKNDNATNVHLELGKCYIINAGIPHFAVNNGDSERVHLVISLDGQEDYDN